LLLLVASWWSTVVAQPLEVELVFDGGTESWRQGEAEVHTIGPHTVDQKYEARFHVRVLDIGPFTCGSDASSGWCETPVRVQTCLSWVKRGRGTPTNDCAVERRELRTVHPADADAGSAPEMAPAHFEVEASRGGPDGAVSVWVGWADPAQLHWRAWTGSQDALLARALQRRRPGDARRYLQAFPEGEHAEKLRALLPQWLERWYATPWFELGTDCSDEGRSLELSGRFSAEAPGGDREAPAGLPSGHEYVAVIAEAGDRITVPGALLEQASALSTGPGLVALQERLPSAPRWTFEARDDGRFGPTDPSLGSVAVVPLVSHADELSVRLDLQFDAGPTHTVHLTPACVRGKVRQPRGRVLLGGESIDADVEIRHDGIFVDPG